MQKMYSGVTSIPQATIKNIGGLKAAQDAVTNRLGSDTVAMFGTSDPDQAEFLTAPFRRLKMMQTETTGTLAYMPDQNPRLETPYYAAGTPFVLDRAGSGPFTTNIARTGAPPAGYTLNDKRLVQKRVRQYYNGSDTDTGNQQYKWSLVLETKPKDYGMVINERLDGDFFPGSIYMGMGLPYGYGFALTPNGQHFYSGDPFTPDGWSGTPHAVVANSATAPVITSISPDTMAVTDGPILLDIYGHHFTGCGFVLLGPFAPGVALGTEPVENSYVRPDPPGAYFYRVVDGDTHLQIVNPPEIKVGVWDLAVIGNDGQVGVLEQCFTVTEA